MRHSDIKAMEMAEYDFANSVLLDRFAVCMINLICCILQFSCERVSKLDIKEEGFIGKHRKIEP